MTRQSQSIVGVQPLPENITLHTRFKHFVQQSLERWRKRFLQIMTFMTTLLRNSILTQFGNHIFNNQVFGLCHGLTTVGSKLFFKLTIIICSPHLDEKLWKQLMFHCWCAQRTLALLNVLCTEIPASDVMSDFLATCTVMMIKGTQLRSNPGSTLFSTRPRVNTLMWKCKRPLYIFIWAELKRLPVWNPVQK